MTFNLINQKSMCTKVFPFYTLSPLRMGKKGFNVFGRMYVTGRRGRGIFSTWSHK